MTLNLILLLIFVLPEVASSVCGRLVERWAEVLMVIALIHEGSSLIAEIVMLWRLLILLLINILLTAIILQSLIHRIKRFYLWWVLLRILYQRYFHARWNLFKIGWLMLWRFERSIYLVMTLDIWIADVVLRVDLHQVDVSIIISILWRGTKTRKISRVTWMIILMFSIECCALLFHSGWWQNIFEFSWFVGSNHWLRHATIGIAIISWSDSHKAHLLIHGIYALMFQMVVISMHILLLYLIIVHSNSIKSVVKVLTDS